MIIDILYSLCTTSPNTLEIYDVFKLKKRKPLINDRNGAF